MLNLILAAALAASTTPAKDPVIAELSKDFYSLELAEFSKPIPFRDRHERKAERIAKKANCNLQSEIGWIHKRVDFALEVSGSGKITRIIPFDTGCRELEVYVINHLKQYAGNEGAVAHKGQGKWFRQSMTFRWPE